MRSFIVWLLCVSAVVASAEAWFLPLRWEVKQDLDPKNMKVITINGKTTAPIIKAQKGDTIVVNVLNNLEEQLALRWEGLRLIQSTPCGKANGFILAGEACVYRLVADQVSSINRTKDTSNNIL
ncbi:hypothetical protein BT93_I0306 [Corymbia citriodora subsp. variegata]|nr:hypothetical protein BT93_I0306 [Corymbia citriodora subsp. variegata]